MQAQTNSTWQLLFVLAAILIIKSQTLDAVDTCEKRHPNSKNEPGLVLDKYNGCFLSCVLEETGVLMINGANQNYTVSPEKFHFFFEKEPLNLYAHTCLDDVLQKGLKSVSDKSELCEQALNFFGCIESWLTMDLTSAIYTFYGTTPKKVFLLQMTKDFKNADKAALTVFKMVTECSSHQQFNVNEQSNNCYSKCIWQQLQLFDETGQIVDEIFQKVFQSQRVNQAAQACRKVIRFKQESKRCEDIERFYQCVKNDLTQILDKSLSNP